MYEYILKPIFFLFDPESVHNFMVWIGEIVGKYSIGRWKISLLYNYRGKNISKIVDGIKYRTPILLSAGFDYNARLMNILPSIGLGGEEIGSVTAHPCQGNPTPRLTRLPKSKSILVNKGLRNDGVDAIIKRIKLNRKFNDFVCGISIARTNDIKCASVEEGIEDYLYSFKRLNEENVGDYYTLNISCPNSFGGESFTDPNLLQQLLDKLKTVKCTKPVYVKMPINISWEQFSQLLEIIDKAGLQGVVIGNLNKNYDDLDVREEAPIDYRGGTSGKPCADLSTELIRKTKLMYGCRFTIIGCGGIMSVKTAQYKINAGADLLQLITGLIYKGPSLVKKICKGVTI
jgi:dihydroorotate dehydrogenase subfamily 2